MNIAISLGGSVFTDNLERIEMFAEQIEELSEEFDRIVVVVGAGTLKKFIKSASESSSYSERDMVGIRATRLNAAVLKSYIKGCFPGIPESMEELTEASSNFDVVVMGGTEPGHSTDAVAALSAEIIGADMMVDVTDVEGVFRDREDPSTKIDVMGYSELRKVLDSHSSEPGKYSLMDRTSVDIIERSEIETLVVDGTERGAIVDAVRQGNKGTRIR